MLLSCIVFLKAQASFSLSLYPEACLLSQQTGDFDYNIICESHVLPHHRYQIPTILILPESRLWSFPLRNRTKHRPRLRGRFLSLANSIPRPSPKVERKH